VPRTGKRQVSAQDPGEVMAAAHNSDLEGARTEGLATAFIARPAEYACIRHTRDLTACGTGT